MIPKGFYTKSQAAEILDVHPRSIERMMKRGVLTRFINSANRNIVLIPVADVERVAENPTLTPMPVRRRTESA